MTKRSCCDIEEVLLTEHSTVKIPCEQFNRKYRRVQKLIEKAFFSLKNINSKSEEKDKSALVNLVSQIGEQIKNYRVTELEALNTVRKRLDYIENLTIEPTSDSFRFYRFISEYLLRRGYYEAGSQLSRKFNCDDVVSADVYAEMFAVERDLIAGNADSCLRWCVENKTRLKKSSNSLEIKIHLARLEELIRAGDTNEAVCYARKNFDGLKSDLSTEFQSVMLLLAFSPSNLPSPSKTFENRWLDVVRIFRNCFLETNQISCRDPLITLLEAGLFMIKTPSCYGGKIKNEKCPVCNPFLNEIAKKIPYQHLMVSRLICPYSHAVMNENNHPILLPNGMVYGEQSIHEFTDANGKVKCPTTKDEFPVSETKRVYVL